MMRKRHVSGAFVAILAGASCVMAQNSDPSDADRASQIDRQNRQGDTIGGEKGEGYSNFGRTKSASEVYQTTTQLSAPLSDLIRVAEQKTGGKAFSAQVIEWRSTNRNMHAGTDRSGQGDMTSHKTSKGDMEMKPGDPVAVIMCATNDKVSEVLVCGKSKEVIATREQAQYSHGSSAFLGTEGQSKHSDRHSSGSDGARSDWYKMTTNWQKASELIGKRVLRGDNKQDVGEIQNIVLEPDLGRVLFLVVDFENTPGAGDFLNAIPPSVLKLSSDNSTFTIREIPNQTGGATAFDEANWPDLGDQAVVARVYQSFGLQPYWQVREQVQKSDAQTGDDALIQGKDSTRNENERVKGDTSTAQRNDDKARSADNRDALKWRKNELEAPQRWQKLADYMKKTVMTRQGEDLGTLTEVAVDLQSGRVLYGIIKLEDKLHAIPVGALKLTEDYKQLAIPITKDQIKNSMGFEPNRWPNLADRTWAGRMYDLYSLPRYWEDGRLTAGHESQD